MTENNGPDLDHYEKMLSADMALLAVVERELRAEKARAANEKRAFNFMTPLTHLRLRMESGKYYKGEG